MIRDDDPGFSDRVALVTGGGRRVGAAIGRELHAAGMNVVLHCHRSVDAATTLAAELNARRADSARVLVADLRSQAAPRQLAHDAHAAWGRLDALINNASTWYATPLGGLSEQQFDDLVGSNLKAPLFLTQACVPLLTDGGVVLNLLDIHARKAYPKFSAYLAAKAGLWMVTEALALELAPRLRVNGIAPGHMLWDADQAVLTQEQRAHEEQRIPLGRLGGCREVALLARFLLSAESTYLTGAVIPVDGGLHLS